MVISEDYVLYKIKLITYDFKNLHLGKCIL